MKLKPLSSLSFGQTCDTNSLPQIAINNENENDSGIFPPSINGERQNNQLDSTFEHGGIYDGKAPYINLFVQSSKSIVDKFLDIIQVYLNNKEEEKNRISQDYSALQVELNKQIELHNKAKIDHSNKIIEIKTFYRNVMSGRGGMEQLMHDLDDGQSIIGKQFESILGSEDHITNREEKIKLSSANNSLCTTEANESQLDSHTEHAGQEVNTITLSIEKVEESNEVEKATVNETLNSKAVYTLNSIGETEEINEYLNTAIQSLDVPPSILGEKISSTIEPSPKPKLVRTQSSREGIGDSFEIIS